MDQGGQSTRALLLPSCRGLTDSVPLDSDAVAEPVRALMTEYLHPLPIRRALARLRRPLRHPGIVCVQLQPEPDGSRARSRRRWDDSRITKEPSDGCRERTRSLT